MKAKQSRTAKIVTVFNQKGGCGKTHLSMQLAGTMGARNLKTFVVDMDPQNTAALWNLQASEDEPFPATVLSFAPLKENFLAKLSGLMESYDVIFIDCPPAMDSLVPWAALNVCDLALLPVTPVMDNIWASGQAEELVKRARQARQEKGLSGPDAFYVLNMLRRGKVFNSCIKALRNQATLPILKSGISMRNVFPESQLSGAIAQSFGDSAGAQEINNLCDEIIEIMRLG
jgi:chromosome partitioning protein